MTLYRDTPRGFPVWQGEPVGEDQVSYSRDIETLWPAEALETVGLWRDDMVAAPDDVPDGKRSTGQAPQRVGGVVKWVHTLEDYVEPVPHFVTRRQARLALLQAGLLELVETAIESMDEPARSAARIEWEDAIEIRRDHMLIANLAQELGLTGQEIDALFLAASNI